MGQDGVDGLVGEELGGADGDGVGPVGELGRVGEAAEAGGAGDTGLAQGRELAVDEAGEGEAEERLVVHDAAGGVVEGGLDALGAKIGEGGFLGGVEPVVGDGAGDAEVFRVFGVGIRERVTAHEEGRGLEGEVVAETSLDGVVLDLEGFDAEKDVEVGVDLGGGGLEVAQITDDALAGGLGDFVVVAPLANHVGAAVASDVEGGGVLEAGAGVVGPEREVGEIGDAAEEGLDGLAVVADGDGVVLGKAVAGKARAERVIDAGAAQGGELGEEALGEAARLEHDHAGFQAVAAAEIGEGDEAVEVGVEVVGGPEAAGELGVDEVVKACAIVVERGVVFVGDEILVGHVGLEGVDFEVGEAVFGEGGDVGLVGEVADGAPVLSERGVVERAVPRERGGEEDAGGEFGTSGVGQPCGEEADGGEEEGAVGGDDFAVAVIVEAEPNPGGGGVVAGGLSPAAGGEAEGEAGAGGGDGGEACTGGGGEGAGGLHLGCGGVGGVVHAGEGEDGSGGGMGLRGSHGNRDAERRGGSQSERWCEPKTHLRFPKNYILGTRYGHGE